MCKMQDKNAKNANVFGDYILFLQTFTDESGPLRSLFLRGGWFDFFKIFLASSCNQLITIFIVVSLLFPKPISTGSGIWIFHCTGNALNRWPFASPANQAFRHHIFARSETFFPTVIKNIVWNFFCHLLKNCLSIFSWLSISGV